jgi:hypothetical protein
MYAAEVQISLTHPVRLADGWNFEQITRTQEDLTSHNKSKPADLSTRLDGIFSLSLNGYDTIDRYGPRNRDRPLIPTITCGDVVLCCCAASPTRGDDDPRCRRALHAGRAFACGWRSAASYRLFRHCPM